MTGTLAARDLTLGYGSTVVIDALSVTIPPGRVTMIIGANACGKSTLLRGLARLITPRSGVVLLDDESIHAMRDVEVAKRLGLLPQSPIAPDGITVADLVGRGRHPHQGWFRSWSPADDTAVAAALRATGTEALARRRLAELSGGQRQRVWIAMALAQETELLLLDEPTTYLDISHQIDVLDLLADLNATDGKTVVAVMHDINLACRYGDHLIAMRGGAILAQGPPSEIVDAELVDAVFGIDCEIVADPVSATPLVVPRGCHRATG